MPYLVDTHERPVPFLRENDEEYMVVVGEELGGEVGGVTEVRMYNIYIYNKNKKYIKQKGKQAGI